MKAELSRGAYSYAEYGGKPSRVGEDVTMELEYAPGRFVVERIARLRLT